MSELEKVKELVQCQIELFESDEKKKRIRDFLLGTPRLEDLVWEYGEDFWGEKCPCWIIAESEASNNAIVYSTSGHGLLGRPWGFIKLSDLTFGHDTFWAPTLAEIWDRFGAKHVKY